MTDKQFDEAVSQWLEETAPTQLPGWVLDATFERTRTSRQQLGWRAVLRRPSLPRLAPALGSAAVVVVATAISFFVVLDQLGVGGPFGSDPADRFEGSWVSTSDTDGGKQTMTVRVAGDGTLDVVIHDDIATVCEMTPSTMSGRARVDRDIYLVVPAPDYTCDDGSEAEVAFGAALERQLRNFTLALDPRTDTLSDGFGGLWTREVADSNPEESAGPATQDLLWPQTSAAEVKAAQALVDAGDAAHAWQVVPGLSSEDWYQPLMEPGLEIVERFLQQELGWEKYLFNPYRGDDGDGAADGAIRGIVYIRCAPGEKNPLYTTAEQTDLHGAENCAPTIDDLRYESVRLDLAQLDRRGPEGIWVVSQWLMIPPFAQADPAAAEAEATALLEAFLDARIDGDGAEGRVDVGGLPFGELPLLYTTTTGAPYERYEIEVESGPRWPNGDMDVTVRLFAAGGDIVVEQPIWVSDGAMSHDGTRTTENGQPVFSYHEFLDGEVSLGAGWAWNDRPDVSSGLALHEHPAERIEVFGDPSTVASSCEPTEPAKDAESLAEAIRSHPDLEATDPVADSVGGLEAFQVDLTDTTVDWNVCEGDSVGPVLTPDDSGSRMRLYLFDAPEGSSIGILAIAVTAPAARFEQVLEAAAPVLETVEFPRASR